MDVASVLRSMHHDRFALHVEGQQRGLPAWADWLIWLGAWMRSQTPLPGRRAVVVRLPTRRLSAAFVSLGAVLAGLRLHDESLDWDALQSLPKGTLVHWRDDKGGRYSGALGESRQVGGGVFLAIEVATPRRAKGIFLLPRATALSYGVTLGNATPRTEEKMVAACELLRRVVDQSSSSWARSTSIEATLVTERSTFMADLTDLSIGVGGAENVPLLDALAIRMERSGAYGKLQLLSARSEALSDLEGGVTILDGATAAARMTNLRARSIVVLLEHAEYDEDVVNALAPFIGNSVNAGVYLPSTGVLAKPEGVEPFVIGFQDGVSTS